MLFWINLNFYRSSLFWCPCLSRFLRRRIWGGSVGDSCAHELICRRLLPDICSCCVFRNAAVSECGEADSCLPRPDVPFFQTLALRDSKNTETPIYRTEFGKVTFIFRRRAIQMGSVLLLLSLNTLTVALPDNCGTLFHDQHATTSIQRGCNVVPLHWRWFDVPWTCLLRIISVSAFEMRNLLKLLLQGPVSFDEAGSRAGVTYIEQNFSKFFLTIS